MSNITKFQTERLCFRKALRFSECSSIEHVGVGVQAVADLSNSGIVPLEIGLEFEIADRIAPNTQDMAETVVSRDAQRIVEPFTRQPQVNIATQEIIGVEKC